MTCRRKTKTERELVADINKAFTKYCIDKHCSKKGCPLFTEYGDTNCKLRYLQMLLNLEVEEEK